MADAAEERTVHVLEGRTGTVLLLGCLHVHVDLHQRHHRRHRMAHHRRFVEGLSGGRQLGWSALLLAGAGHKVGKSLCENDLIDTAKDLASKTHIPEFVDVVVGKEFDEKTPAVTKDLKDVADDDMIFDLGPKSMANINEVIKNAKTILWNGPVGVFEFDQFAAGTKSMADAIANSDAFSVAGGGDTINSIQKFGVTDKISYISTGGGAFLEFVEGKKLPAVEILEKRAAE